MIILIVDLRQSYQQNLVDMTEKQQKFVAQSEQAEDWDQDIDYENYHLDEKYEGSDLDIEEDYLKRLKEQRIRIEDLSLLHRSNEERLQKEIERNKQLRQEIEKLSSMKDYQCKYSEISGSLEISIQQNKTLKDTIEDLKSELFQSANEKTHMVQRLKMELNLLKEKESSRIESLEEALSCKDQQIEKLQREAKSRERQLIETINSLKSNITRLQDDHDSNVKAEQRKSDRLERELQSRSMGISEIQSNVDSLLKENSQMKGEIFRLSSLLGSRQLEIKSMSEKFKMKLASMKKELKNKDKECIDLKEVLRKTEKDKSDNTTEVEELRIQIKKLKETTEITSKKLEVDFNVERQSLQSIINQHITTIDDLINVKNDLAAENRRLQAILKKKEVVEKQRRQLLRTELKQIDKLEKVIDRIVE